MKRVQKPTARIAVICAAVCGATVAGAMLASPRPAMAQSADAKSQQPVTLDFVNGDINSVLQALFKDIGANFSIDPDVHGTVTISMSNVGFLAALRSVMRANNPPLTFEYVDGVYHVRLKHLEKAVTNENGGTDQATGSDNGNGGDNTSESDQTTDDKRWYKIPIDHYDVVMMAKYVGGMDKKQSEVVPSTGSGTGGAGGGGGGGAMGGGAIGGGGMGGMR